MANGQFDEILEILEAGIQSIEQREKIFKMLYAFRSYFSYFLARENQHQQRDFCRLLADRVTLTKITSDKGLNDIETASPSLCIVVSGSVKVVYQAEVERNSRKSARISENQGQLNKQENSKGIEGNKTKLPLSSDRKNQRRENSNEKIAKRGTSEGQKGQNKSQTQEIVQIKQLELLQQELQQQQQSQLNNQLIASTGECIALKDGHVSILSCDTPSQEHSFIILIERRTLTLVQDFQKDQVHFKVQSLLRAFPSVPSPRLYSLVYHFKELRLIRTARLFPGNDKSSSNHDGNDNSSNQHRNSLFLISEGEIEIRENIKHSMMAGGKIHRDQSIGKDESLLLDLCTKRISAGMMKSRNKLRYQQQVGQVQQGEVIDKAGGSSIPADNAVESALDGIQTQNNTNTNSNVFMNNFDNFGFFSSSNNEQPSSNGKGLSQRSLAKSDSNHKNESPNNNHPAFETKNNAPQGEKIQIFKEISKQNSQFSEHNRPSSAKVLRWASCASSTGNITNNIHEKDHQFQLNQEQFLKQYNGGIVSVCVLSQGELCGHLENSNNSNSNSSTNIHSHNSLKSNIKQTSAHVISQTAVVFALDPDEATRFCEQEYQAVSRFLSKKHGFENAIREKAKRAVQKSTARQSALGEVRRECRYILEEEEAALQEKLKLLSESKLISQQVFQQCQSQLVLKKQIADRGGNGEKVDEDVKNSKEELTRNVKSEKTLGRGNSIIKKSSGNLKLSIGVRSQDKDTYDKKKQVISKTSVVLQDDGANNTGNDVHNKQQQQAVLSLACFGQSSSSEELMMKIISNVNRLKNTVLDKHSHSKRISMRSNQRKSFDNLGGYETERNVHYQQQIPSVYQAQGVGEMNSISESNPQVIAIIGESNIPEKQEKQEHQYSYENNHNHNNSSNCANNTTTTATTTRRIHSAERMRESSTDTGSSWNVGEIGRKIHANRRVLKKQFGVQYYNGTNELFEVMFDELKPENLRINTSANNTANVVKGRQSSPDRSPLKDAGQEKQFQLGMSSGYMNIHQQQLQKYKILAKSLSQVYSSQAEPPRESRQEQTASSAALPQQEQTSNRDKYKPMSSSIMNQPAMLTAAHRGRNTPQSSNGQFSIQSSSFSLGSTPFARRTKQSHSPVHSSGLNDMIGALSYGCSPITAQINQTTMISPNQVSQQQVGQHSKDTSAAAQGNPMKHSILSQPQQYQPISLSSSGSFSLHNPGKTSSNCFPIQQYAGQGAATTTIATTTVNSQSSQIICPSSSSSSPQHLLFYKNYRQYQNFLKQTKIMTAPREDQIKQIISQKKGSNHHPLHDYDDSNESQLQRQQSKLDELPNQFHPQGSSIPAAIAATTANATSSAYIPIQFFPARLDTNSFAISPQRIPPIPSSHIQPSSSSFQILPSQLELRSMPSSPARSRTPAASLATTISFPSSEVRNIHMVAKRTKRSKHPEIFLANRQICRSNSRQAHSMPVSPEHSQIDSKHDQTTDQYCFKLRVSKCKIPIRSSVSKLLDKNIQANFSTVQTQHNHTQQQEENNKEISSYSRMKQSEQQQQKQYNLYTQNNCLAEGKSRNSLNAMKMDVGSQQSGSMTSFYNGQKSVGKQKSKEYTGNQQIINNENGQNKI